MQEKEKVDKMRREEKKKRKIRGKVDVPEYIEKEARVMKPTLGFFIFTFFFSPLEPPPLLY